MHLLANEWGDDLDPSVSRHYIPCNRLWFLKGVSFHRNCTHFLDRLEVDTLNSHGVVGPAGGIHWAQSLHASWIERSQRMRPPFSAARLRQRLNPLHRVLLRLEERHFRDRAYKKIIVTTSTVRNDLARFYNVPTGDVVIIPNGFNPSEFSPELRLNRRNAMRLQLGLAPRHLALLFVANELERKGFRTILGALKALNRDDVRLLVVGRSPSRQVMAMAAAAGVAAQVIACGATSDVAGYHAAADLFVLPTQYEAFCLAILEALGSGVPVVTTNLPGARDAVRPGVNGTLIDDPRSSEELAAAILPLLDSDIRARLSDSAPATVADHQWPILLQRYERVLLDNAN